MTNKSAALMGKIGGRSKSKIKCDAILKNLAKARAVIASKYPQDAELLSQPRKPIPGWEGLYEVTRCGAIISLVGGTPRALRPCSVNRYSRLILYKDGSDKTMPVHRAVAMAWIPNPENLPHINHKDGNPKNNHADNLEWTTPIQNMHHAISVLGLRARQKDSISFSQAEEIRAKSAAGESLDSICANYKISLRSARKIIRHKRYIIPDPRNQP